MVFKLVNYVKKVYEYRRNWQDSKYLSGLGQKQSYLLEINMKFLFKALLSSIVFGAFLTPLYASCWYKNNNPNDVIAEQNGGLWGLNLSVNRDGGTYKYTCQFNIPQKTTLTLSVMGDDIVNLILFSPVSRYEKDVKIRMHYDLNHRPDMTKGPEYQQAHVELDSGDYVIEVELQNNPYNTGFVDLKTEFLTIAGGVSSFVSRVYKTGALDISNVESKALTPLPSRNSLFLGDPENCRGTNSASWGARIQICCYPGGDPSVYTEAYRIESKGIMYFGNNITKMIWENIDDQFTITIKNLEGRPLFTDLLLNFGSGSLGFYPDQFPAGYYEVEFNLRNYGGDATANIYFQ